MTLRYVPPLNSEACRKADGEFYTQHHREFVKPDGTRIPLSSTDPNQEGLRQEWLALYKKHHGKVKDEPDVPKPPQKPDQPCAVAKTVTAKIVSLTFRSDHLGGGKKLLRPSAGDFKDATAEFAKPEWQLSPKKSDPISHTKNLHVTVDVDIEFTVNPPGCTAQLAKIAGKATDAYLTFEKTEARTVVTGVQKFTGLVSQGKLTNQVDLLTGKSISWTVMVEGEEKPAGSSGPHKIYVTYALPIGQLESPTPNQFQETGPIQDVTEERLQFSVEAAKGRGIADEKECVDAVFEKLLALDVSYDLGKRWEPQPAVNNTGVTNGTLPGGKPTLHHYMWRCNAATATGECHNIAACFMLACRILGVKDPFEIGFMYPWPSRKDNHPTYSKRGDSILGKYNVRHKRSHAGEAHGDEHCLFIDGNNFVNNFEGVAKYRTAVLYAIGEGRYDVYSDAHQNASVFYSKHSTDAKGKVTRHDLTKGMFDLCFLSDSIGYCKKSYPWKTALTSYPQPSGWTLVCSAFYWHE